jgi:GNAT superfamily N-acetyltransferase
MEIIERSKADTNAPQKTGLAGGVNETVAGFDAAAHWHETLSDGTRVLIRPIHKEDAMLERAFLERLSPQSRTFRFLGQVKVSDDLIRKMTDVDYRRDAAFIALHHAAGGKEEIGVSRFCLSADGESCECAVTVSDEWQGKGLGTLLMRHLIEMARQRGIKRMISVDMTANIAMHTLADDLGFSRKVDHDYPTEVVHTLQL